MSSDEDSAALDNVHGPQWPQKEPRKDPCTCVVARGGRNLVVCIDGTSNQFSQQNTNVIELYSQLVKDDRQLTYYNSGIGTYATPSWKSFSYWKQVAENKIDLAIAWNFERIVLGAYRWLADNHRAGDRIFLFGFSRGAYQVWALAGMIEKVGLIHKGNEEQIPFAYELYADRNSAYHTSGNTGPGLSRAFSKVREHIHIKQKGKAQNSTQDPTEQQKEDAGPGFAEKFKATFSKEGVRTHFIGAWDTVSSVGMIRGPNLPLTDSTDHICYFRHALALDERRVKFLPEYAHGSTLKKGDRGTKKEGREENDEEEAVNTVSQKQRIKETWFTGTHSDIGGGNVSNPDLNRSNAPFLWMTYEAISADLLLKPSNVEWKWEELGAIHESLTGIWKVFEYIPFKRLTYKPMSQTTIRLHKGRGRRIQPGQTIHASVAFSKTGYAPKAVFPLEIQKDWSDLIKARKNKNRFICPRGWEGLIEMDIFDVSTANAIVENLEQSLKEKKDLGRWAHRLFAMTWSEKGRDALLGVDNISRRLLAIQVQYYEMAEHSNSDLLPALVALGTGKSWFRNDEAPKALSGFIQEPTAEPKLKLAATRLLQWFKPENTVHGIFLHYSLRSHFWQHTRV